ncbi:MAG: branched-chain amino acid ABC transporter permease [Betaproteobacteria bacterium]|nr:branched-chain amino acid ABC transporter permease [Betaproteobacteria bacterium]
MGGILLNGLASAMILYIIAIGLSITMGLMGFANLAHCVFASAGGYAAIWGMQKLGLDFWVALGFATIVVALIAIPIERLLYAPLYGADELDQVLFTIGLIFIAMATAKFFFGPSPLNILIPAALQGQVDMGVRGIPAYRLVIIVAGFLLFALMWLAVEKTPLGAQLRAAVDNRRIAEAVGVRTDRLFTLTFALGSGLAALGGALGAEILPIRPTYAFDQLNYVLIVVSVGGLGTLHGPFFAALLLGISDTACKYFLPEFGAFFIFAAMIAILLWRPNGLFGIK